MSAYANGVPHKELAVQTAMFAIGSTLMHSAACVLNDICDIDFDRQVGKLPFSSASYVSQLYRNMQANHSDSFSERCKTRPLPAGLVTVPEAWTLLMLLVLPAVAMLLFTNQTA